MSTLHAKIENICRLCLSGDDNLESIFGDSGSSDLLQMIIYDCTTVKVSPKLGYPSSICGPCKSKVENFHQFREQCIHNDEYLRSTFLEPEVVIKTEPDFILGTGDEEDDDDDDINEADIEEWDESESNEEMQLDSSSVGVEASVQQPDILLNNNGIDFNANPALVPLFKCDFCSAEFAILEHLERHITSHKEEKIFKCFYCPKTFHFAKNLNMHVEYIHSKVKYSQRTAIKTDFALVAAETRQADRERNVIRMDDVGGTNNNRNEKPAEFNPAVSISRIQPAIRSLSNHECHVCHKSFSDLRQHMLLHDGEKPYKCDICSKSFFNASTLKTHYRVHSDENPFRCTTCTKVFDNARSLELHYRTHTGERPYTCDVCLKKFSCSSNLKRHRKLHDRD